MLKEYQVVRLKTKRLEPSIPEGTKGTILLIYAKPCAYEVEFVANDGRSLGTATIKEEELSEV
jgi:hypothetical protein